MGHFTRWLQEWRADRNVPFPPEAAEQLATLLYEQLERSLSSRIVPAFGFPTAEELISDQVELLHQIAARRVGGLPTFVVDSKTLAAWLYRGAWWRLCRDAERRRSKPGQHGLSAGDRLPDGSCDPRGMDAHSADEVHRGDVFAVESAGLAVREALDRGLDDLRQWKGDGWVFAFEQVCLHGRSQADVAGELKVADGTVSRRLDPGRFCVARRLGYEHDQLVREFGERETREWTASLEKALGT